MTPLYILSAPPHLASALASGAVTPMATSGGLMTTLVNASGTIVGTAHLVPASGAAASVGAGTGGATGASALVAGGSIALGPAMLVAGAVGVVGVAGFLAFRRYKRHGHAKTSAETPFYVIHEWVGDDGVLAEADRIIEKEAERLANLTTMTDV